MYDNEYKTEENKIEPRIKLNHNTYMPSKVALYCVVTHKKSPFSCLFIRITLNIFWKNVKFTGEEQSC